MQDGKHKFSDKVGCQWVLNYETKDVVSENFFGHKLAVVILLPSRLENLYGQP